MKIDHRQISPEALQHIIESFIQREGTDYGEQTYSLQDKVAQVKLQLTQGQASLVFDAESESVNLLTQEELLNLDV